MTGHTSPALEEYLLLAGAFGLASAAFVVPRLSANSSQFFDFPVFITILVYLRFAVTPIYSFFNPRQSGTHYTFDPAQLPQALLVVVIGMVAFWCGSSVVRPKTDSMNDAGSSGANPLSMTPHRSVGAWIMILALASSVTRLYLLKNHLYSYLASFEAFDQNLAAVQVLGGLEHLGNYALILAAIEHYSQPSDPRRRFLFYAVLASESVWGLVSGMKGVFMWSFLAVIIVSSRIRQRLRIAGLLGLVLLLILLYPFSERYRLIVRTAGAEVGSLSAAGEAGEQAFSLSATQTSGMTGWLGSGADATIRRLSVLEGVAAVIYLGPTGDWIRMRGVWWTLPFYAFVPRFVWSSKPIDDIGRRFSVALGADPKSCSSITHPGDAYLEFGIPGVIISMFVLGIFSQWLSARSGTLSVRRLFIFVANFWIAVDMEGDVFGYWSTVIKSLAITSVIAWLVYRPPRLPSLPSLRRPAAIPRRGST
jgi:hypothetical protein